MSVVIWDGTTLASDRGAWRGNVVSTVTKLHAVEYHRGAKKGIAAVGFVGDLVRGNSLHEAIASEGYPLKTMPVDGLGDTEALVLLLVEGEDPELFYHDGTVTGIKLDIDQPIGIGNPPACAAALALVAIAGMDAHDALREMVAGGRFDSVAGGVDWCSASKISPCSGADTEREYTPEMDKDYSAAVCEGARAALGDLTAAMEAMGQLIDLRNFHFGAPDARARSVLNFCQTHINILERHISDALDVDAAGGEAQ